MPQRLAAIVLAAGASRRMGRCKQLLPIGNRPAIVCCLEALVGAGIEKPVVVGGADLDPIAEVLRHVPLIMVHNPLVDSGMAGSVRVGLNAISDDVGAVMICLADQPLVAPETIRRLLKEHAATPERILIPVCEGRRGHPTVFPVSVLCAFRENEALILRDIVRDNVLSVREVEVSDRGVILDMDTPSEYRQMQRHADADHRHHTSLATVLPLHLEPKTREPVDENCTDW